MEFRMLGPLEAWHGETRIPLGDLQQRFVLVVLLLHANKPVSPERLTEIVWPGKPDRRTLVRSYIKRLRTAFEPTDAEIETTPTGYVLRIDDDRIDAVRFGRLCEEAARAVQDDDQHRAVDLLRTAVGLWRGLFLEDIDIDRVGGVSVISPAESYGDAVGDLAELELVIGDHRSARDRMRRALPTDPASQRYAELLMRALIAGGDGVNAIRVYKTTCDALEEAGYEPGSALRKLAALAERGAPVSSLPSRPGGFTGRAGELATIAAAASGSDERRAVWISGAHGTGKSGLAVEAAHRLRQRFPDGQILVRLNGFTPNVAPMSVSDALTQLLTELGTPVEQIPDTVGRKASLYQSQLYGTRTLVVLDDATSPEQIRPLLPETRDCFAIVTSRRMGEPDISEHVRLAPMPPEDASTLFQRLTGHARVHGRTADVAGLVKRCGYLPVSITVAAALLRKHDRWSLDHLLGLMDDSGAWREDSAAILVSYQQLDDRERHAFRLFGHLTGPDVDVVGAAALIGDDVAGARRVLHDLHEVCLLEEVAPDRYRVLDSIKEFAAAQPSEAAAAQLRLLDFYLVTLANAVGTAYPFDRANQPCADRTSPLGLRFDDRARAVSWMNTERDTLSAAIRHAGTHGLVDHAWRLAVLVWRHHHTANRFADWVEAMELARDVLSTAHDPYGEAHVLLRLATAEDRLGRHTEALGLAEQSLLRWRELGDVRGEATSLCTVGLCTMQLGRHREAIAQFESALEKYEQCGDRRGQAHALSQLGYLHEQHREHELALRHHSTAVEILREIGHQRGLAHALNNRGAIRQHLGVLDEAIADHFEAHEIAEELGDAVVVAYALTNIADAYRLAGKFPEALHHHRLASEAAGGLDDADLAARLCRDQAATASDAGDRPAALRLYQQLVDRATGTGNRTHRSHGEIGVARTMHALGRHAEAVEHWQAAEAVFAELGQPEAEEVRAERAVLACACGQR
ncbi:tetratricopeptide repeat protein [Lentzea sp. NPDC060358]|uniref:AfsR/SARP family transcriptional regulator n=1 Tax=Lentzea sp. NPDC060358 TaxID=3347103 RepID=UPI00365D076D